MNPFTIVKVIKTHFLLIIGAVISIMWVIIQGMRRDKEKVKADLATGEAKAIKRAMKAQQEAREQTSEQLDELEERRINNTRRDID